MSGESVSKRTDRGDRDDLRGGSYASGEGRQIENSASVRGHTDIGGASRFFYTAKASAAERIRVPSRALRLRSDITPEQVDHVTARLREAGVSVD